MVSRREVLEAGGLALAGLVVQAAVRPARADAVVQIHMRSAGMGAKVWFDPIGLRLRPGQTVRWVLDRNVHTTTAYHPRNLHHPLRIPREAQPWNSGYLIKPGSHFDVTLVVEGVYDYFCIPHEAAGMVGRLVVGHPGGPGSLPFDYYRGQPGTADWAQVPPAARAAFPDIATILREGIVRRE